MPAFDQIIGYELIRHELTRTADALAHAERYAVFNAHAPKALLLHGRPGVGKTLMAKCLIEESGRPAFVCRRDEAGEAFVKSLKQAYAEAAKHAPSIVFLDDLDKFSNEDEWHSDTDEYVAVQACIDAVGDADVFTLATANSIKCLPDSLLRSGRLGNKIEVGAPSTKDAKKIIEHYLHDRGFASNLDMEQLARIMKGRSCADLEAVINEAGLLAAYERGDKVDMMHLVKAVMSVLLGVPTHNYDEGSPVEGNVEELRIAAYHEAGHAIAAEAFDAGSVALVSLYSADSGESGGVTITSEAADCVDAIGAHERNIIVALAGRAATEQRFGFLDAGTGKDLKLAFDEGGILVSHLCLAGFELRSGGYRDSESLSARQEQAIAHEVGRCYHKAKELLAQNGKQLEMLAELLLEKKLLLMSDIASVNSAYPITRAR